MSQSRNKEEYHSNIIAIRAVEDSIRATRKYTEGIGTMWQRHPIQGDRPSSKVFCKYYEVYPSVEVGRMTPSDILEWITGYSDHINVVFRYDYRDNKASIKVKEGNHAVKELSKAIPGFSDALAKAIANGNGAK